MTETTEILEARLRKRFGDSIVDCRNALGEITVVVAAADLVETARALRDEDGFGFEILIDLAGIDYLGWGGSEWEADTSKGSFGRAVEKATAGRFTFDEAPRDNLPQGERFAVVYHLLSVSGNRRLRLRAFAPDNDFPVLPTVTGIWVSADWYEREAFDLFGIAFDGHPDLRRLLTDYGFIGHPFRKDFPLVGHVEMRYDPGQKRVVYEPVTIEPRVLVPRVIREGAKR